MPGGKWGHPGWIRVLALQSTIVLFLSIVALTRSLKREASSTLDASQVSVTIAPPIDRRSASQLPWSGTASVTSKKDMASLPEHWESDYDGARWFFRYKPTGIVQYTFPKPGDEYPEYIDAFAPPFDLPPEEKLESQQQKKRRSTAERSVSRSASKRNNENTSATLTGPDDGGGGFQPWFQPDFMYLGPGSYNDISPLPEDEEEELGLGGGKPRGKKISSSAEDSPATQPGRSYISPSVSAGNTPLSNNSQPANVTPMMDSVVATLQAGNNANQPRYSPLGVVAELQSEMTAQCREETHPAAVELPGHGMMHDHTQPLPYANAFDIAPAELPAIGFIANHYTQGVTQEHPYGRQSPHANVGRAQPPPPSQSPVRQHQAHPSTAPENNGPSAFHPPQLPLKQSLDGTHIHHQVSRASLNSEVIKGARPPSPAKSTHSYGPYRDLQEDIDNTVELLSEPMHHQELNAVPPQGSQRHHSTHQEQRQQPSRGGRKPGVSRILKNPKAFKPPDDCPCLALASGEYLGG
ncbi:hypothetical protein B0T25DRAFT_514897 [Lasiosphaeria hispida]|uniref:WW domain-containing protein n=1 Tax=Lasiosphaeria hispida TaxID=260671 RepID=A0AAJ0MHJ7_9PEZI|nr:hypothetical protein B0T25DRAFT_514897 [Lasiosphaeria hispida]